METCANWGGSIALVRCLHQGNIYTKRQPWVWTDQKCIHFVGIKPLLPVWAVKLPRLKGGGKGPRTETCANWGGSITMVPCLHQGYIYIKRELGVWRVQKCIPLVGAKTPLICAGRETTPSQGRRYRAETETCVNSGGSIALVPCVHQGNIYIKRQSGVWRVHNCIPLIGRKPSLNCGGSQTTMSEGMRYRAEKETCANWGGSTAMVRCFHQGYVYIKRELGVWRVQKCIPTVGA